MNGVTARLSALALIGLLALGFVGLIAADRNGGTGREVHAEFTDAWPLVEGMDVRVSGAVAGSVRRLKLSDKGTAEVTLVLKQGVPAPRADASVMVRQQDLLGDSYISLSLGDSAEPLDGPIQPSRAIQAPRLDDFLNTFTDPVRAGMQTFFDELGMALEQRGADLNATILQMRPGFRAVADLLAELRGQNGALRDALTNAHAVTSQLAGRTKELDSLVTSLAAITTSEASHSAALDADLARLPAALSEARTTLSRVSDLSDALPALSHTFAEGAPTFTAAAKAVGPFSDAVRESSKYAAPTLKLAGSALRTAGPGLSVLAQTKFSEIEPASKFPRYLQPAFSPLLDGLFGSTKGGGLGGVFSPGNDLTAPKIDPQRGYLAAVLVPSCEILGEKIAPGCLTRALAGLLPTATKKSKSRSKPTAKPDAQPVTSQAPTATATPKPDPIGDTVRKPLQAVQQIVGNTLGALGVTPKSEQQQPPDNSVGNLLDFLLKP